MLRNCPLDLGAARWRAKQGQLSTVEPPSPRGLVRDSVKRRSSSKHNEQRHPKCYCETPRFMSVARRGSVCSPQAKRLCRGDATRCEDDGESQLSRKIGTVRSVLKRKYNSQWSICLLRLLLQHRGSLCEILRDNKRF